MDDHWENWKGTAFLKIWIIKKLSTTELMLLNYDRKPFCISITFFQFSGLQHHSFIYSGNCFLVPKDRLDKGQKWYGPKEEDIKKRWQEYTELYRKDLHDPDNHDGVITHLEPDILECKVKWALESITMNKG